MAGQAVSVRQVLDVISELDELVLMYGQFSCCFHVLLLPLPLPLPLPLLLLLLLLLLLPRST